MSDFWLRSLLLLVILVAVSFGLDRLRAKPWQRFAVMFIVTGGVLLGWDAVRGPVT